MALPPRGPVVVLTYDGVAADETGAVVEILTSADLDVIIASVGSAPVTSFHGRVFPTRTIDDLRNCSALIIPGGMGVQTAAKNQQLAEAVRQLAESATWLGATSTGSVLLAAAGVVDGARATTHWLAGDLLTSHGLTLVNEPFVEYGRLLTASGLVSSATLAFRLIGALAGVEAERRAKARYQGRPPSDPRYRRRKPSPWLRIGRRRTTPISHPLDPSGQAEITILDLDLED
ncbi:MAG: hypothetical protein GY773_26990 [Actinomycetia bacterium]|nr:hypothetical protein [Actinomycetes bacterium]